MASSSEGKTSGESLKQCGSCKANSASKYCTHCKIPLCSMCSNIHKNIPATQNHAVTDIQASSKATSQTRGKCSIHSGQAITYVCEDCCKLICNLCKPDHNGHDLLLLTNDPKTYKKICGKHIQQLIEDLQEIEELKSLLESHITTYDEALFVVDKWEHELIKLVKEKAAKLKGKIKQLKDEKFKRLEDKVKGLKVRLHEIDNAITKLNDIRKSMDTGIISNELSKSQELIRKLETLKSELGPLQPAPGVDKMLPRGDLIKDIDGDLDLVFTMDTSGRTGSPSTKPMLHLRSKPKPVAEWIFTKYNGGKDLSQYGENPMTLTNIKYGSGPYGQKDSALIFPTSMDQSIIVMNPTARLRFKNALTFFTQVYIDDHDLGYFFNYNTGLLSPKDHGTYFFLRQPQGEFGFFSGGLRGDILMGKDVTPKCWCKIALVLTTSNASLYVDGKRITTMRENLDLTKTGIGYLHIGRVPGEFGLNGRMSSAKFYDTALTESEIQKL